MLAQGRGGGENTPKQRDEHVPVLEVRERAWPAGFVSAAIDPTSEGVMVGRDFCQQRDGFQIIPNPSRRLF